MSKRIRDQYKFLFGEVFAQIAHAPDWHSIDATEKAQRLEDAFRDQSRPDGGPAYSAGTGALFKHAIECLELPDEPPA